LLVVEAAVEVEDMTLKQRFTLRPLVECRPVTQRYRGPEDAAVGTFEPAGVDPLTRKADLGIDREIGGREAELGPPTLVTVFHDPPDLVWSSEKAAGTDDITVTQHLPNGGRGDLLGRSLQQPELL